MAQTKQFGVAYDAAAALTGPETWSIVQGGVLVDVTATQVQTFAAASAAPPTGTGYYHVTGGVKDAAASTAATVAADLQGTGLDADACGFRGLKFNSQSANYTAVAADAGGVIYHPTTDTTPRTWTIPANASVAFEVGTAITFDNDDGAGAITIAITSDTLVQVSTGATGSRTLAAGGSATAWKVTATRWRINGAGLS